MVAREADALRGVDQDVAGMAHDAEVAHRT
jgi:hypothetical protein